MTEDRLAQLLIEGGTDLDKKVSVYLNRLLLRIFSVPSLMSHLADVMPVKAEDGSVKIQLDFLRLPNEVMPQVERLIAAPGKLKWYKYVKNGSARTGAEIAVKPDDFDGDSYDYAT